jgi:hypothetical protein
MRPTLPRRAVPHVRHLRDVQAHPCAHPTRATRSRLGPLGGLRPRPGEHGDDLREPPTSPVGKLRARGQSRRRTASGRFLDRRDDVPSARSDRSLQRLAVAVGASGDCSNTRRRSPTSSFHSSSSSRPIRAVSWSRTWSCTRSASRCPAPSRLTRANVHGHRTRRRSPAGHRSRRPTIWSRSPCRRELGPGGASGAALCHRPHSHRPASTRRAGDDVTRSA